LAARFVRDEEAAGSNPATPTIKLQVAALFCVQCRLPASANFRFWERVGADLAANGLQIDHKIQRFAFLAAGRFGRHPVT
jgi:hypothetical protein